ncbi:hypothetical protein LGH83_16130 [Lichenihabitans sp. PAMC28606]|uniref:hypothetical protein n=1 Tax=Lichenihabitans sp. PAMC28606 TaxID=2880932 RepID=UPI001D09A55A|nr:hypothetical protein [Lichenihabitans sp. PAMC28606]UDL94060.1 hypothetical protein LGH83_16130 [Lichenihabitans sp. PAMC28606]
MSPVARANPLPMAALKERSVGRPKDWFLIGLWIALVMVAAIWIAPFVFIVFTALKSEADINATAAYGPPTGLAWQNFRDAWTRGHFSTTLVNSALITFIKVPVGILVSAMAAYALSQMRLTGAAHFRDHFGRHHDPVPGAARTALQHGEPTGPSQHLSRGDFALHRLWRALPDLRSARLLSAVTWEMTVTRLDKAALPASPALRQRGGAMAGGEPEAAFGVKLPGKPYQAVRIRPVRAA